MPVLFRQAQPLRFVPDADPIGAPAGVLLRADNTVSNETGARTLRKGSLLAYSGFQDQRVQSIYTALLQGSFIRFFGVDDQVYHDGVSFGFPFDGSGDISFGDDSYQCFFARGTTKKKYDGTTLNNWGLTRPILPPAVTAVAAVTTTVATFASGETPGTITTPEGTSSFINDYNSVSNAATALTPDSTSGRASWSKVWASDQDFLNILGVVGGQTDIYDMMTWFEEPRNTVKVTVMFGLGTGADPFVDDYYTFDWPIKSAATVDIKDVGSSSSAAYGIAADKLVGVLSPDDITEVTTPEQAGEIMGQLGSYVGQVSQGSPSASQNSPAWGHLAVTRGQFTRVGSTAGRDWSTIRGFKVVYTVVQGTTKRLGVDAAVWAGGGSRALTGTYNVGYRFARTFKDTNGGTVYTELSPMSPISTAVVLNQQTMQVSISAFALNARDPQADSIWIYVKGGWCAANYYRFAITSASIRQGMTIDDLTTPSGSNFNTPEKQMRLDSFGFTVNAQDPSGPSGPSDLQVVVMKSEMEAMIDNVTYEPGTVGPPDNIIGIAGPWANRLFCLTSEGWVYPSSLKNHSTFSLYHAHTLDLRRYGTPYWIVSTANGITVGCSKDIVQLVGDASESNNHVNINLYPQAMGVANPPVDRSVCVDGNAIIYRSADGLMSLVGASFSPIPDTGMSLLWQNKDRNGIQSFNVSAGRFRLAVDNHNLYMLAPEGDDVDPTACWKWDAVAQEWLRYTYNEPLLALHREATGRLLAGTADGDVLEIENGQSDNGNPISIYVVTPFDDDSNPRSRKDAADIQIQCDTGGAYGTLNLLKDGSNVASYSQQFYCLGPDVFRADARSFGRFLRAQVEITGAFSTFALHSYGLSYRSLPPMVMVLDCGYLTPSDASEVVWPIWAEIDCIASADLILYLYKDDVLHATLPIPVKTGVRSVYRTITPPDTKASRMRAVFVSTNSPGPGNVGFEPYMVRFGYRGSGNVTEMNFVTGDQSSN